jgi:pimeloyl-ACP methyl ester carboxylesterase
MDAAIDAPKSRYYHSQGLRLHFTDWGNPQASPLLLVHGGLDHSRSWDHLAHALRRDFHVVAADLRGHGESEWATGSSYSLADHVYDLVGLVKAAGFENVSIVGHSMGGMVSLAYAGVFPAGVMKHFENAELARIEGAGHWLQHDKADEVLDLLKKFFEQTEPK